ncbi:hypothetical protein HED60_17760 [Planctomycetales bacterium ZRK34]|nr:hypothetical protein HED60_17760 [Planctomycetales bacterium ZRK34]
MSWPDGLHAQAITTPTSSKPRITITRVDGDVFDIVDFSFKLLADTSGAGASLEVTPKLNGEDAFNDPVYFEATGYHSKPFSYNRTPTYLGQSTALLKGYDTYVITLYVDYGLTSLTVEGAATSVPEPAALTVMIFGAVAMIRPRRRAA